MHIADGGVKSSDTSSESVVGAWSTHRTDKVKWSAPVHAVRDDAWMRQFELAGFVGAGGYGQVVSAIHRDTRVPVAIKHVKDRTVDGAPTRESVSVQQEISALRMLDHPFIVGLIEVFQEAPKPESHEPGAPWVRSWYLIMELCEGSSMDYVLTKKGALDLTLAGHIFAQLAEAVHYMHWRGVVHRDIKPANVVLIEPVRPGGTVRIKLLDLGLSEVLGVEFTRFYRSAFVQRSEAEGRALPELFTRDDSFSKRPAPPGGNRGFRRSFLPFLEVGGDDTEAAITPGLARLTTFSPRSPHSPNFKPNLLKEASRFGLDMTPAGTLDYAAPEVQNEERFKSKDGVKGVDDLVVHTPVNSDSFSLGVFLRCILTGVTPEVADVNSFVKRRRRSPVFVVKGKLRAMRGKARYQLRSLEEIPGDALHLLNGLCDPDFRSRFTMGDVHAHPWVQAARESLLEASAAGRV